MPACNAVLVLQTTQVHSNQSAEPKCTKRF
jgi:hypothetical protein